MWAQCPASRVEPAPCCLGTAGGLSLGVCGLAPASGTARPPPSGARGTAPPIPRSPGRLPPASSSSRVRVSPQAPSLEGPPEAPGWMGVTASPPLIMPVGKNEGAAASQARTSFFHNQKMMQEDFQGNSLLCFSTRCSCGICGASECLGDGSGGQVLRPGPQACDQNR